MGPVVDGEPLPDGPTGDRQVLAGKASGTLISAEPASPVIAKTGQTINQQEKVQMYQAGLCAERCSRKNGPWDRAIGRRTQVRAAPMATAATPLT